MLNCYSPYFSVDNYLFLGLFHEQGRPDRDDYVDILFENIQEGNFRIYPTSCSLLFETY